MITWRLVILTMLTLPAYSLADDSAIYESMAGIKIGRVFLAPGERDRLDRRRLRPQAEKRDSDSGADGKSAAARVLSSAGYIISSSGKARVWRDGDFVESRRQEPQRMRFPGDVKVTRSNSSRTADATDTEDHSERPSEADSDEE